MTTKFATLNGLIDLATIETELTVIDVRLIANGLARLERWGRQTPLPYSVAQHSVMVAEQLPPAARIYGLLHDAHEFIIGDETWPVEVAKGELLFGAPGDEDSLTPYSRTLKIFKERLDTGIRLALGVPAPAMEIRALVHEADLRMAATEWGQLVPPVNGRCPVGAAPYPRVSGIKCWPWEKALDRYAQALERELATKSWKEAA